MLEYDPRVLTVVRRLGDAIALRSTVEQGQAVVAELLQPNRARFGNALRFRVEVAQMRQRTRLDALSDPRKGAEERVAADEMFEEATEDLMTARQDLFEFTAFGTFGRPVVVS